VEGRTPSDAAVVLREESSKLAIRKQQHDSTSNRKEWVSSVSCLLMPGQYNYLRILQSCAPLSY
jgi:hypothetical protein